MKTSLGDEIMREIGAMSQYNFPSVQKEDETKKAPKETPFSSKQTPLCLPFRPTQSSEKIQRSRQFPGSKRCFPYF